MLTDEDKVVLAHMVEDPDAWIAHALATVGVEAVFAKCRRDIHVAAYRVTKDAAGYKPRGPLPSDKVCAAVAAVLESKTAQQGRVNKLFS